MTTTTLNPAKQSTQIPDHVVADAKSVDLTDYAGRFVELRKEAAAEWAGPCPKCGGADRFHVTKGWFFCRKCHPQRGDAIEFERWRTGCGFRDAVASLANIPQAMTTPRAPERRQPAQAASWLDQAQEIVNRAHHTLLDLPEGQPGRDYLGGRALSPDAVRRYQLGYVPLVALPGTRGKQAHPALVIPWLAAGRVRAVRYRFLTAHTYTDDSGAERTEKQSALRGSQFYGLVWGGPPDMGAEAGRTLILCEGELNCASIWQVGHDDLALDAYSLGSESATIPAKFAAYAGRFRRVIVWADRADVARTMAEALPGAHPIRSPKGLDANDLLQAGKLADFLAAVQGNVP